MTTKKFPLSGPINLEVRVAHGSVKVETADDLAEATVRIEPGKHGAELLEETTIEMRGPTLTIAAPRQGGIFDLPLPMFGSWRGKRAALDVHVMVPTGTAVKISTFTAAIWIPGRVGGADLSFGAAEAAVRDVDGDLRLRFGSGTAKAVHVHGSVELRSGSGDAQFGRIDGGLTAGCGNGNLHVRVVQGAVRARCGSGEAKLGEVHGDVDLAAGSGPMEIGLPAGVTARLDVATGSGEVRSELPIDEQQRADGPSITLRARTGSGDVRLFRAA